MHVSCHYDQSIWEIRASRAVLIHLKARQARVRFCMPDILTHGTHPASTAFAA